jgi:CHAT domain-containing protein
LLTAIFENLVSEHPAFYIRTIAGRYQEALQQARRAIKAKYTQPFFWAVFILHGEG